MEDDRASFTAVLVCQARAAAHGRVATQRFADPVAMALLTDSESAVVRQVRDQTPPQGAARLPAWRCLRAAGTCWLWAGLGSPWPSSGPLVPGRAGRAG